jgi:hypothetical protein
MEMAVAAHNGVIGRQTALLDHFTTNMYPPIPLVMMEAAEQAIDAMVADEPETIIALPPSISIQRDGRLVDRMSARQLVDVLHIGVYVEVECHERN